jgi:hypothetical protein
VTRDDHAASERGLYVLTSTVIERHFVDPIRINREFGVPNEDETWEDFVIRVFERFDGSIYGGEFFPSDANPQVGHEVEPYDPEA